ncbi:hypothetical protein SV7mr_20010 [Stieleria bergensis]|uniref:Uncharacterized protein n=1 Tax=Stieleria bergensis TaxID=2528025 RepID=A0A517STN7_9BACT|nr:hypothetical protein SV7mr_20010 [Planctomycetes bacterium SV_7m_r]
MNYEYKYLNLTQLGKLFDVTSHVSGKWLKELGLRSADGKPSARAFNEGFVVQADNGRGGYYYVWHRKKTIAELESAGHRQIDSTEADEVSLHGPFDLSNNGSNGYEIKNSDGATCVWLVGEEFQANRLVSLMNLAHKRGHL